MVDEENSRTSESFGSSPRSSLHRAKSAAAGVPLSALVRVADREEALNLGPVSTARRYGRRSVQIDAIPENH